MSETRFSSLIQEFEVLFQKDFENGKKKVVLKGNNSIGQSDTDQIQN